MPVLLYYVSRVMSIVTEYIGPESTSGAIRQDQTVLSTPQKWWPERDGTWRAEECDSDSDSDSE